jgi:NADP-dependent 3-hydroxy acid dehydrogenase YdfG
VDILVNNAGVKHLRPAVEVSDDWAYVVDMNLRGFSSVARSLANG